MNWDDPKARYELMNRVGADEYNRMFEAHRAKITVATINGWRIIPVNTARFGQLYMVEGKDKAFPTQAEAEAFAKGCEAGPRAVRTARPGDADLRR